MTAHIEWIEPEALTGVLRIGPEGFRYGDPYPFSCTIVIAGDLVEFKGAMGNGAVLIARHRDYLREQLRPLGVRRYRWERRRDNGKMKEVSGTV